MTAIWHTIRGYVAGGVAFVSCPCHLPITLPLLVTITAGTVFSIWLSQNFLLVAAISTAIFIGGFGLAMLWLRKEITTVQPNPKHKSSS